MYLRCYIEVIEACKVARIVTKEGGGSTFTPHLAFGRKKNAFEAHLANALQDVKMLLKLGGTVDMLPC